MFGCVFEGIYKGKACAVKVLHEVGMEITLNLTKGGAVQEARLSSFEKECENLFDLKHPNIVELLHVRPYPPRNLPCLVMELLDCSLCDYLKENSDHLPMIDQISLSCDTAKPLAYLHIIHRDLCGDNILIQRVNNKGLVAKITDFGMSRIMEKMTHSIIMLGHRSGFLPPEAPLQEYDFSLNIYMFGVIMVQIVHAVPHIKVKRAIRG